MKGFFCWLWLGLKLGSLNSQEEVIRVDKTVVLDGFFPSGFVTLFLKLCYDILVFSLAFLQFSKVKKFKLVLDNSLTKNNIY